jgi:hypothetical protein
MMSPPSAVLMAGPRSAGGVKAKGPEVNDDRHVDRGAVAASCVCPSWLAPFECKERCAEHGAPAPGVVPAGSPNGMDELGAGHATARMPCLILRWGAVEARNSPLIAADMRRMCASVVVIVHILRKTPPQRMEPCLAPFERHGRTWIDCRSTRSRRAARGRVAGDTCAARRRAQARACLRARCSVRWSPFFQERRSAGCTGSRPAFPVTRHAVRQAPPREARSTKAGRRLSTQSPGAVVAAARGDNGWTRKHPVRVSGAKCLRRPQPWRPHDHRAARGASGRPHQPHPQQMFAANVPPQALGSSARKCTSEGTAPSCSDSRRPSAGASARG